MSEPIESVESIESINGSTINESTNQHNQHNQQKNKPQTNKPTSDYTNADTREQKYKRRSQKEILNAHARTRRDNHGLYLLLCRPGQFPALPLRRGADRGRHFLRCAAGHMPGRSAFRFPDQPALPSYQQHRHWTCVSTFDHH